MPMPHSPSRSNTEPVDSPPPTIHWAESDKDCSALWRSERGAPPPKRVILADDTVTADSAYRLACEGTALLWRGDFHNATQLLQAMARRADRTPARKQRKTAKDSSRTASPGDAFHQYRLAQSQRARVLGSLLIPFNADRSIGLRRAPDARQACAEAWGPADAGAGASVASLRGLLGIIGAPEGRKKSVESPAPGATRVSHRVRGVRRGQPHAARVSEWLDGPPRAGRRGLAHSVRLCRASGLALACRLAGGVRTWRFESGGPNRCQATAPQGRGCQRSAARRARGRGNLALASGCRLRL